MKNPAFYKARALKFTNYILDNKTTSIKASEHFGVSKTTIQNDIETWLPLVDVGLYSKIKKHFRENKAKGFSELGKIPRTLIECECTNCKHNNAISKNAKGYCTLSKITLTYKEFELGNGDETDVADCEMFHFMYKGKEFMKG